MCKLICLPSLYRYNDLYSNFFKSITVYLKSEDIFFWSNQVSCFFLYHRIALFHISKSSLQLSILMCLSFFTYDITYTTYLFAFIYTSHYQLCSKTFHNVPFLLYLSRGPTIKTLTPIYIYGTRY